MAKELDFVSLLDVFPPSIREDLNVQANAAAFDPEFHLLAKDIKEVLLYPRLDELPEPLLDLLAWERHVDFYELAKTVEAKREVIRSAPAWHRKKGTVWAILKALEMFGIKGTYTNWYEMEPQGRPGTFALDAELTDEYWNRADWNDPAGVVRRAVVESKAKRSWMSGLYVHIDKEAASELHIGGAVAQSEHQVIGVEQDAPGDVQAGLWAGGAVTQAGHQVIGVAQDAPGDIQADLNVGAGLAGSFYMKIDMVA